MGKLLLTTGLLALVLAQSAAAMSPVLNREYPSAEARGQGAIPFVQVQYRPRGGNRGGGGGRQFNANGFQRNVSGNRNVNRNRNVTVNRNVNVNNYGGYRGNYGPNWGGVAAGVAVGVGIGALAAAAAAAPSYPPPPPYPYAYPPY